MDYNQFILKNDLLKNDDLVYTNSMPFAESLSNKNLIYVREFKNFLSNWTTGADWIFSYEDTYYPFQYDALKGVCILSHDLEYFKDDTTMDEIYEKYKLYKLVMIDCMYFCIFIKR
jgi:hypothetical protein